MATLTSTKRSKPSLPIGVQGVARLQRMVLAGCFGKAPMGVGAGIGILAYSMREGLGSPIRRRPRHTESEDAGRHDDWGE